MGEVETEEWMVERSFYGFGGLKHPLSLFPLFTQTHVFLGIEENQRGFVSEDITQTCRECILSRIESIMPYNQGSGWFVKAIFGLKYIYPKPCFTFHHSMHHVVTTVKFFYFQNKKLSSFEYSSHVKIFFGFLRVFYKFGVSCSHCLWKIKSNI